MSIALYPDIECYNAINNNYINWCYWFYTYTHGDASIIAHTRQALRSVSLRTYSHPPTIHPPPGHIPAPVWNRLSISQLCGRRVRTARAHHPFAANFCGSEGLLYVPLYVCTYVCTHWRVRSSRRKVCMLRVSQVKRFAEQFWALCNFRNMFPYVFLQELVLEELSSCIIVHNNFSLDLI